MPENHRSVRSAAPKARAADRRQREGKAQGVDLDDRISGYVGFVVAGAPPLTQEQRHSIAALLRGGAR